MNGIKHSDTVAKVFDAPRARQKREGTRKDALAYLWKKRSRPVKLTEEEIRTGPCSITATGDSIMKLILAHKKYQSPGTDSTIKNQPKYENLDLYDVPEEKQEDLWRMEMNRLLKDTALDSKGELQSPPTLTSKGQFAEPLARISYEKLSTLYECILMCWHICVHDNELIAAENLPKIFDAESYGRCQIILTRAVQSQPTGFAKSTTDFEIISFYELVDYLTATCARVLVQTSDNEFWQSISLAVLVKWATKMKVLARNPQRYAQRSLDKAEAIMQQEEAQATFEALQKMSSFNAPPEDRIDAPALPQNPYRTIYLGSTGRVPMVPEEPGQAFFTPEEDKRAWLYFLEMASPRRAIYSLILLPVVVCKASTRSRLPVDAFEISTIVFGSDLLGYPTILSQDRDGEITGSSTELQVRYSYPAFNTLRQVVRVLARQREALAQVVEPPPGMPCAPQADERAPNLRPESSEGSNSAKTILRWEWESSQSTGLQVGALRLLTMGEVLAILMPLSLTQPAAVNVIAETVRMMNRIITTQDPVEPVTNAPFSALYYVRTSAYDMKTKAQQSDAKALSESLLAHHRLLDLEPNPSIVDNGEERVNSQRTEALELQRLTLDKTRDRFKGWNIDERSISVKIPRYVATVDILCFVLVVGGIVCGLTVGDRIKGVDPFNIATFSWAFAAFVFIIAKSILVENWPWKDFLRGEVVCRSVSELSAVTGMPAQDIIAYLLGNEYNTVLITRGPYNRPFGRRGEDGFAIDQKIALRTLLRSNVIVFKVATPDVGPGNYALHIFDLRRGWRIRSILHAHDRDDNEDEDEQYMLMCIDPPIKGRFEEHEEAHLIKVRMSWNKVLGIYHKADTVFR